MASVSGGTATLHRRPSRLRFSVVATYGFIGLAVGLSVGFFLQAGMFEREPIPAEKPPDASQVSRELAVTTSTITGIDEQRRPYTIRATSVQQDATQASVVHLSDLTGEIERQGDKPLIVRAGAGRYDKKAKLLDLDRGVHVVSSEGLQAVMPKARMTMSDRRMRSDDALEVTFDRGVVSANGLEISDDGQRILLFNGVKVKFNGGSKGNRQP